jgi:hypothetical protein
VFETTSLSFNFAYCRKSFKSYVVLDFGRREEAGGSVSDLCGHLEVHEVTATQKKRKEKYGNGK